MSRNFLIALGLVAIAAAMVVWWAGLQRPDIGPGNRSQGIPAKKHEPAQAPPQRAQLDVKGVDIEEKDAAGNLLWKLRAEGSFIANKEDGTAKGKQVKWEFIGKGEQHWHAEAPATLIYDRVKQLVFVQGVRVWSDDKSVSFEAPKVVYQGDTRKLVADGPVTITIRGASLTAGRVVVDTQEKELRAQRVTGHYRF
jgi:LPS export ABC transporter protein LptC